MYMAPEQAHGKKLDQRADLFSFGSVLYQMLSGRPPFRAPTTMAVLKRVTEDAPRPIQEIISSRPGGYGKSPTDDPAGPAVPGRYEMRAVRGGSFMHPIWKVRSSKRDFYTPDNCFFDRGFRVAATITQDVVRAKLTAADLELSRGQSLLE